MWHTTEAILNVLRPDFEDRIISRKTDGVWLPRSCDLTPLDYYLWGADFFLTNCISLLMFS